MEISQEVETRQHNWFASIAEMTSLVYRINQENGWFDEYRSFGDDVALLHSEISEMFEAFRNGNLDGEKDSMQDEAADILIRLLDTCYRLDISLVDQFVKKCKLNANRGYKHGGKKV